MSDYDYKQEKKEEEEEEEQQQQQQQQQQPVELVPRIPDNQNKMRVGSVNGPKQALSDPRLLLEMRRKFKPSGVRPPPPPKQVGFQRNKTKRPEPPPHHTAVITAPPLELTLNSAVMVVNGDRSNLTWKKYKLISIDSQDMCTVVGQDGQQSLFPRRVVKPKGYIKALKDLFNVAGTELEFRHFQAFLELIGCPYDHNTALTVFRTLDIHASGAIDFQQFINWIYGIGKVQDTGRLLTMYECVSGIRRWDKTLKFWIMTMVQSPVDPKQHVPAWHVASIDEAKSNDTRIMLASSNIVQAIPINIKVFKGEFQSLIQQRLSALQPKFRPTNQDPREIHIVVMGASGVGKSALLTKYVKGIFLHDYDPTMQETFRKNVVVDDNPAQLEILDTAGQEEFVSLRYSWLRDGIDILMACFSRADVQSFYVLQEQLIIAKRLLQQSPKPRKIPLVVVGTKSDDSASYQVSMDDITEVLNAHGGNIFCRYVECSAFNGSNLNGVFETVVRMYREWREHGGNEMSTINNNLSVELVSGDMAHAQSPSSDSLIPTIPLRRGRTMSIIEDDPLPPLPIELELQNVDMQKRRLSRRESVQKQVATNCMSWLISHTFCCPNFSQYLSLDDNRRLQLIGRVPRDRFPNDIAPPVFCARHFQLKRSFHMSKFIYALLNAIIFPIILVTQTLMFIFYSASCDCCYRWLPNRDYTDPQMSVMFDFLAPIVGRDQSDLTKFNDGRKWFLSQTLPQKIARLILTPIICILFVLAFLNGYQIYFVEHANKRLLDPNLSSNWEISVMEYLGPLQLWAATWIILAWYFATETKITPEVPNMLELRPFVLYFGNEESLRTTAYVFLRGFSKSTLEIHRLEATWDRLLVATVVSIIYSLIPGFTRSFSGRSFWPSDILHFEVAVSAFITNLLLVFVLTLVLQMQLLSGLQNYVEWMEDVTSLLDPEFAANRQLPYLSFFRQSNSLSWIEMRSYLYAKGLTIASRQEIFVGALVLIDLGLGAYLLYRLITERYENNLALFQSETYNGLLFLFVVIVYALLRMVRTTGMIEVLQTKQKALLNNQKMKVYYRRVSWVDNDEEETTDGVDFEEAQRKKNTLNAAAPPVVPSSDLSKASMSLVVAARLQRPIDGPGFAESSTANFAASKILNAQYLKKSESLIDHIMSTILAQDISPRVFNVTLHSFVGFTVMAAFASVIPTVIKSALGDDNSWGT